MVCPANFFKLQGFCIDLSNGSKPSHNQAQHALESKTHSLTSDAHSKVSFPQLRWQCPDPGVFTRPKYALPQFLRIVLGDKEPIKAQHLKQTVFRSGSLIHRGNHALITDGEGDPKQRVSPPRGNISPAKLRLQFSSAYTNRRSLGFSLA